MKLPLPSEEEKVELPLNIIFFSNIESSKTTYFQKKTMERKTTILFVQPNSKLGGSFQSLYYLLKNIDKTRYETTVLLPQYNRMVFEKLKSVSENILINNFPSIAISINFKYRFLITSLIKFFIFKKYYLRKMPVISADIIHLNSLNSAFGLLIARKFGIPLVWHIREQFPPVFRGLIRNFFQQMFKDRLVKHLICISENEARYLPKSKVHIIHNFYQLNNQTIPKGKPIKFLSIGSFTFDKGFWRLIDAVRYLSKRYTPSDFKVGLMGITTNLTITKKILGEKTEGHFKTEIKKHQIEKFFEFYPNTQRIGPEFFAQFHVLVRPSLNNDPWGRDIIEAMSTGRGIIATGSYAKFVRHRKNGYLVSGSHPHELAKRMEMFIDNERLVSQFGCKSFNIAQSLFNPHENTWRIEKLYEDIIV